TKDLAPRLLAPDLGAVFFIMATDVDGIYRDWGTPTQARIDRVSPAELDSMGLPAGSMGPKAAAASEFVAMTGGGAAIGSLDMIDGLVDGTTGTQIVPKEEIG